jgi:hypothetical protein
MKFCITWVCGDCGAKYGNMPNGVTGRVATWHMGKCGVCLKHVAVTEPRDFGYLKLGDSDLRHLKLNSKAF